MYFCAISDGGVGLNSKVFIDSKNVPKISLIYMNI